MEIKPEIQEKIITAANALLAEGVEHPTNDQVRQRLGGGSLSHISPVMRAWRASRQAAATAALDMPAELKKTIESVLGQVWASAQKLACATTDTVRQAADAAVKAATGERDEALAEVGRLEARVAELQKTLADKDQAIHQVQDALEQARAQSTQLASDHAALATQVKERQEQIKSLKAELKEARNDHKALQRELVDIARKTGPKKGK